MHHSRLLPILTALALSAPCTLNAAELGEPVVKSHVGQQLVADIELLPDEGGAVRAYIAHDDVYRGANIARSPVIDTLHMSVMRRDGRQFLHITSIKPVEAAYLHLFLDLAENGKLSIRPATLWLQPVPPAPVRVAAPAPAPVPAPQAQRKPEPVPAKAPPPRPRPPDLACQALDYTNAQLSAQIVDLEEKVKALQYAIDMQGTRPVARPVQPRKPAAARPAREEAGGTPVWAALAGGGMLALGGGGWWWRRSRRRRAGSEAVDSRET
ncbi:FimV family protein [Pseudoduganella sp. GCM10020061]|uniref:type IV pilus assembly protein FimV n=1 Tax=Pseudoduganella sp. GCM10020061 TaxID=3317345 RepID=UPI003637F277